MQPECARQVWYRLTYRSAWNATHRDGDGTHEYLAIKTVEEAEAIAKAAPARAGSLETSSKAKARQKNQNATRLFEEFRPRKRRAKRKIPALTFRGYRFTLRK